MILAAGHYKETQHNYVIASVVNIVVSCVLVTHFGIIGVTVGAACALYYQTVWMVLYVSKNLISWPIYSFTRQICIDAASLIIAGAISCFIDTKSTSYIGWIIVACKIAIIWIVTMILINSLFYKENMKKILRIVKRKLFRFSDL